MDWIDEKYWKLKMKLKNASLKKALLAYILLFVVLAVGAAVVSRTFCNRWMGIIWSRYAEERIHVSSLRYYSISHMSDPDRLVAMALQAIYNWCIIAYTVIAIFFASLTFYRRRLKEPFQILEHGTREIKNHNLDFSLVYDSTDEVGCLCASFEEMRMELVNQKQHMWKELEEKQRLNAAFAHDLRTPLTVLRGYTDILVRYVPERKIGEEKLLKTLQTMSEQIIRLENYSNTMKNIHSLEEMTVNADRTVLAKLEDKIMSIIEALNTVGAVEISYQGALFGTNDMWIDEQIILEVLENLLSNAIRYAKEHVIVSMQREEKKLCLYVQDDGIGFSKEAITQAVKPYYQEEEQVGHFGIGLYICQVLCEKHEGEISLANSMMGGGIVSASFTEQLQNQEGNLKIQ